MKILVSVPNTGLLRAELVSWLFGAQAQGCQIDLPQNRPLDVARNVQVKRFFTLSDADAILTIDSDTVPPPDTIARLVAANKDIVAIAAQNWNYAQGGLTTYVCSRNEQGVYEISRNLSGLVKCDAVGFGCVLIKRHVLEAMLPPWFQWLIEKDGCGIVLGEDLYFCQKAQQLGFEIWADCDRLVSHYHELDMRAVNDYMRRVWDESRRCTEER